MSLMVGFVSAGILGKSSTASPMSQYSPRRPGLSSGLAASGARQKQASSASAKIDSKRFMISFLVDVGNDSDLWKLDGQVGRMTMTKHSQIQYGWIFWKLTSID